MGGESARGWGQAKQSKDPLRGDPDLTGDSPSTLPRRPRTSNLEGLHRPLEGGVPLHRPILALLELEPLRLSRSMEDGRTGEC